MIERSVLEKLIRTHGSVTAAAEACGIPRSSLRGLLAAWKADEIVMGVADSELVEESVRAKKRAQALEDLTRVERKAFREHARIENAVTALAGEIRDILSKHEFTDKLPARQRSTREGRSVMIIQWSDQHLNERVELEHNTYDWGVAAARLRKHVLEAMRVARAYDITDIMVAMTGDLINSDRRMDELASNAGNRARACVLAVDLYQQAIRELASEGFNVTVGSVTGNESRIQKDIGWCADVASDSYDVLIHEHLSLLLEGSGVNFLPMHDPGEMLVDLNGTNCLFIHGHGAVTGDIQKSVQAMKGRWLARGHRVDLIFWGHVHEALVADNYARSSSLVGTNDYAEKALNYTGRASQNLYVVLPGGGFHGIKVDLQSTKGIEPYRITKRLEAYNTKSASKARPIETIHRVVI